MIKEEDNDRLVLVVKYDRCRRLIGRMSQDLEGVEGLAVLGG